ncbi:RNA 3'-terminal phosphate cyclase [Auriculariales sp. MPI-PUGE-AT-0066]|nr:RNA 3'-terminal phosphate cyclase [Auriculariales sp. MPI-PUGE-AT-0066]
MSTSTHTDFHELDGATLEGGGQLLRNSVAYSALLGKPIFLYNVRAGRPRPGMQIQHVAAIQLGAQLCNATTEGAEKRSNFLKLTPGPVTPGHYTMDPGGAGATPLWLQASLPCLIFSHEPSTLTLRGGTNTGQSQQIDCTIRCLLPFLHQYFDLKGLDVRIVRRGYFPKGGGELFVSIPGRPSGAPLPAATAIERGRVLAIKGYAYTAGLPVTLANEMRDAAWEFLQYPPNVNHVGYDVPIEIQAVREDDRAAFGCGSGIILWAETESGCVITGAALGRRGRSAEDVAREAVDELGTNLAHGGCLDEYLQDQLIIFMALADGQSSISCGPLTMHTRTAIWVAEQMTDATFQIEQCSETNISFAVTGSGSNVQP